MFKLRACHYSKRILKVSGCKPRNPKQALSQSITKWKLIVKHCAKVKYFPLSDGASRTCSLCQYYWDSRRDWIGCNFCPLSMCHNNCMGSCSIYHKFNNHSSPQDDLKYAKQMLSVLEQLYKERYKR